MKKEIKKERKKRKKKERKKERNKKEKINQTIDESVINSTSRIKMTSDESYNEYPLQTGLGGAIVYWVRISASAPTQTVY